MVPYCWKSDIQPVFRHCASNELVNKAELMWKHRWWCLVRPVKADQSEQTRLFKKWSLKTQSVQTLGESKWQHEKKSFFKYLQVKKDTMGPLRMSVLLQINYSCQSLTSSYLRSASSAMCFASFSCISWISIFSSSFIARFSITFIPLNGQDSECVTISKPLNQYVKARCNNIKVWSCLMWLNLTSRSHLRLSQPPPVSAVPWPASPGLGPTPPPPAGSYGSELLHHPPPVSEEIGGKREKFSHSFILWITRAGLPFPSYPP